MSQLPPSEPVVEGDTEGSQAITQSNAWDSLGTPTTPVPSNGSKSFPPLSPRPSADVRPLPIPPRLIPLEPFGGPIGQEKTDADGDIEYESEASDDSQDEPLKKDISLPPPVIDSTYASEYKQSKPLAAATKAIIDRHVPSIRPAPPVRPNWVPQQPNSRPSHRDAAREWEGADNEVNYPWETEHGKRYPFKGLNKATEIEYPPDRYGEEAGENARVWKLYRNRASELDNDQIEGWNKTLDILLIFAGLFSAVATAFVIESYKNIKPDYSEIMAKAFVASLIANGNVTAVRQSIAEITHFKPPGLARYVNLLWFFSLTLALVVALLAILAKQWLSEYSSRMRAHSASQRRWAWRHVVFSAGLKNWGMDTFVSTLPLMMHGSLFLFLLGLVAFLTELDLAITAVVLMVTVAVIAFYAGATIMPLWHGDCPTVTPLLRRCRDWLEELKRFFKGDATTVAAKWNRAAYDEERIITGGQPGHRDAVVLRWMLNSLPAVDEADIVLDAIGALDPLADYPDGMLNSDAIRSAATSRFNRLAAAGAAVDPEAAGHCLRTLLFVGVNNEWKADQTIRSWEAGYRWRNITTHDLHVLCDVVLFPNGWTRKTMEFVSRWTADTTINTGQNLPILPSTLSLIFLRANIAPGEVANVATDYCDLLEPLSSPARDFDQRRTAFILLDSCMAADGVCSYDMKSLKKLRRVAAGISKAEEIQFQALRTLGYLINYPKPYIVDADVRKRAAAILTATVSRSRPVADLSDSQHEEMIRLLDLVSSPGFASSGVHPGPILRFIQQHLILDRSKWSHSHGKIAHRGLHLDGKITPPRTTRTTDEFASGIAGIPRCRDTAELAASSWTSAYEASRHSRINLLVPRQQGGEATSTWKLLCGPDSEGRVSVDLLWLALDLVIHLCILSRSGLDVKEHAQELLGGTLGFRLIRLQTDLGVKLALHAREVWPEWWDKTKEELQKIHMDWWNVCKRKPHKTVGEFIKAVEEHSRCTSCPDHLDFMQKVALQPSKEAANTHSHPIMTLSSWGTSSFWGARRVRSGSQCDLSAHGMRQPEQLPITIGAEAV